MQFKPTLIEVPLVKICKSNAAVVLQVLHKQRADIQVFIHIENELLCTNYCMMVFHKLHQLLNKIITTVKNWFDTNCEILACFIFTGSVDQ